MVNLIKTANFLKYRFRYLINYVIIGFFSILLEVLIVSGLSGLHISYLFSIPIGFLSGVFFAFILNAKLNFKVPKSKNSKTFFAFLIISIIALFFNFILMEVFSESINLNYSSLRFITATLVFMVSYTAHRKITFNFIKQVGIAIHLNKGESVSEIYSKIKYYADFIHLDLVDKTFKKDAKEIDLSLLKQIQRTWRLRKMLHIMSKKPSVWVRKLHNVAEIIIFHLQIGESIKEVIGLCKKYSKKVGISISPNSKISELIKYLPYLDFVQVMGIDDLGESGHLFNPESLEKVRQLNKLRKKYKFEIIFDGGIKPTNINQIDARYIVSASGLLHSKDPIKSFMELKTSSRYNYLVEKQLRKDIIENIRAIVNSEEFIVSGTIVGSFSESNDLEGISDLDIVLILDKLTKQKFDKIIQEFEKIKQELASKYGYNILLNSTLGPLKFYKDKLIVFHVMVYDKELHKIHCEKSPFTCLDWQRSKLFFKNSMSSIYSVKFLQPSNFFNSRRSAEEYLSEIKENKLSYREYFFSKNKILEEKHYKSMTKKGKIEFAYHILRFLMINFLKIYHRENKKYTQKEFIREYFKLFPRNKAKNKKLVKDIFKLRKKKKFEEDKNLIKKMQDFIKDFEFQFKDYFYKNSKQIMFIRHEETKQNIKNFFLGQKLDPDIINPAKNQIKTMQENLKEFNLVFSSPLKRCIQTLELANKNNIIKDNKLKEIDYGKIDGKSLDFLSKNYPDIVSAWKKGQDPRFPDGENTKDVLKRIRDFTKSLNNYKQDKILVCTHNVVLRTLIGSITNIPLKDWYKISIPHLEPIKLILTKDNKIYIDLEDNQIKEIFKDF